ncbi:MAG: NAD(P)H-hydrate epimerase, partial [Gammaproteobacteria bacterium]
MAKSKLPSDLYDVARVRARDQAAMRRTGVSAKMLMTQAAAAALQTLQRRWPNIKRIIVVCGQGNNAGDG